MNVHKLWGTTILLLGLVGAAAQTSTPNATTVALSEHAEDEAGYLTDAEGRALYLYTDDEAGVSNCSGECAENWPPLLTQGPLIGLDGVAPGLLDTTEREDGSEQVTYIGHPLYYFAQDQAPGDINGQGAGDVWYLVSLTGEPLESLAVDVADEDVSDEEEGADAEAPEADPALVQAGGQVYSQATCIGCHGSNGEGGVGVALAENGNLVDVDNVVSTILGGRGEMPSFASRLSDDDVAAVATYVRNTWGNAYGAVTPEDVAQRR